MEWVYKKTIIESSTYYNVKRFKFCQTSNTFPTITTKWDLNVVRTIFLAKSIFYFIQNIIPSNIYLHNPKSNLIRNM